MQSQSDIFSKGFLWGAATSAYQVEGGNRNDWSEWEHANAKRLSEKAGERHWPDFILKNYPNPLQEENYISGRACDHYNRFREDFDIAKQLGHNAHRFSIEWSRIEPEEGKFDEREIEHYREVIRALRERGMEPFVTLWHWTIPLWVRDKGGWESDEVISLFLRYCKKIAGTFREEVRYWMVINEPIYWLWHVYIKADFPPQKRSLLSVRRAFKNLVRAHKKTYQHLKFINRNFQIGVVESTGWHYPWLLRFITQNVRNFIFPSHVQGHFDFFGLKEVLFRLVSLLL